MFQRRQRKPRRGNLKLRGKQLLQCRGARDVRLINTHNTTRENSGTSFDLYSLRHTFAMRPYAKTKHLVAVQLILGHVGPKTAMCHTHVDQEHLTEAIRLYEELCPLPEDLVQ